MTGSVEVDKAIAIVIGLGGTILALAVPFLIALWAADGYPAFWRKWKN